MTDTRSPETKTTISPGNGINSYQNLPPATPTTPTTPTTPAAPAPPPTPPQQPRQLPNKPPSGHRRIPSKCHNGNHDPFAFVQPYLHSRPMFSDLGSSLCQIIFVGSQVKILNIDNYTSSFVREK